MQGVFWATMAIAVAVAMCLTQRVTVKDVASMEHVRNAFGHFFVIHDHEFADHRFKTYDVTNELRCRFIALADYKTIYSISRDQNGAVICKVFNHWIANQVKFQPKLGVTSFYEAHVAWHFPYKSGVFYHLDDGFPKSYDVMMRLCTYVPNYRRMPITRTNSQKEIMQRLASSSKWKALYVGLEKRNNGFVWQGTDDYFDEDLVQGVLGSLDLVDDLFDSGRAVAFTSDGEYKYVPSDMKLAYFCSYKPFEISEWD